MFKAIYTISHSLHVWSPSHYWISCDDLDPVKVLMSREECNLSITDQKVNTPLHSACKYGYHFTIEFLTAAWSEMSVKTSRTGRVKLIFILPLNIGHLEIVSSTFQMNKAIPHCTQHPNMATILYLNSLLLNQIWDANLTHRTKRVWKLLFILPLNMANLKLSSFL